MGTPSPEGLASMLVFWEVLNKAWPIALAALGTQIVVQETYNSTYTNVVLSFGTALIWWPIFQTLASESGRALTRLSSSV